MKEIQAKRQCSVCGLTLPYNSDFFAYNDGRRNSLRANCRACDRIRDMRRRLGRKVSAIPTAPAVHVPVTRAQAWEAYLHNRRDAD